MKSTSLYPEKSPEGILPSTPRGYTATREQLLQKQPLSWWNVAWETAGTLVSPERSGQYFYVSTSTFHSWGRLRVHIWWVTMSQVMSDSISVEKHWDVQHRMAEPIQHFTATGERQKSYTPYITLRHALLLTFHQLWCFLGASGIWYNPVVQQQIISKKAIEFSARIRVK